MNFKQATDALLEAVTLEDLARAMGVSIQAVRQARAAEGSDAHRRPPEGWEGAIKTLAGRRATALKRLSEKLSN